ncbi:MAG: NAD(P)-dependent oxidoreductase [Paenibacillus sp.]|uniref:NAD(P)-dependent oxidoreductase n=1 Tax=Paenibacillus sp. TaxID=58172 RepID=UPI0028FE46A1|nr:NAD(P)-dependent oxidoreductase [Paenibacillus sp.]MDU2242813.1 NAD(P)-dependent oxidoreductase [Paenibacillus sp.]
MKIAVIGATGKAGSKILEEALARGLSVTAIVRSASKLTKDVPFIEKDVLSLTTQDLEGFDAVVQAFGAPIGQEEQHVIVGRHLIDILSGISTRLIVVGGAGSLFVDPELTTRVVDTPDFPEMFLATAKNQMQNLLDLQVSNMTWTFISPSAFFDPAGGRTGSYTLGQDRLLVNRAGESYISYADYAIAVVDEIEKRAHMNQRFTVVAEKA